MSTWGFYALTKAPMRLWHRFHKWRAMRKYVRIITLEREVVKLKKDADRLIRKHVRDPQERLDLGDD